MILRSNVVSYKRYDFWRYMVRKRDNFTCQMCRKVWQEGMRNFDVHHIDPDMESTRNSEYDKNNMDKMVTLCHRCHINLPHVKQKIRDGLLRSPSRPYIRIQLFTERNNKVKESYFGGKNMREVGEIFNISKERVRQILLKDGSYHGVYRPRTPKYYPQRQTPL